MKELKKTVPTYIAEELALRISKGLLHPNEHLIETAIADEFSTSRAPVREALLMLERDRLVTRVPHKGFVVKKFTKEEIHQLYDATFRLEEIAMERAISNATQTDTKRLEENLEKQRLTLEAQNTIGYYELNEEFHSLIFSIAKNDFIAEMHRSLRKSARPLSILNMGQRNNMLSSYEEHRRQLDALKDGDVEAALMAIRDQEARSVKTLDIFYPH